MEEKISALRAQLEADRAAVHNKQELSDFWQKYLSKNGAVTGLTKGLRDVPKEERPAAGKLINDCKVWAEGVYEALAADIAAAELEARNAAEAVDITLPGKPYPTGGLHPITLVKNEIIDVFAGMGFEIYEGPEIEDDDHNFTRLNVPKNHPARDMQDTFYVAEDIVLRTQTSGGQIRVMDAEKPPIKVLVPGRVFRSDSDATHSPMFHQMEGLVVDKNITLCDLQGMLDKFVQALFGPEVKTRLRPSYFPFHRAERRSRRLLLRVRRQGLRAVQAHRLDRGAGRGCRAPQRAEKLRHRPRSLLRLCLRHRHRTHCHAQIRHQQHWPDV